MKRYIFPVLLLISFSSIAQQSTFGILGGATISGYTSSEIFQNSVPLVGVSLGVYRGITLTKSLALEPGLYFTQRGISHGSSIFSNSNRNRLSYLILPVVMRKNLTDNFSVHIGPYLASFIHGSYRYPNNTFSERWSTWGILGGDRNIPDAQFDVGLQAGLRYILSSQFVINASYELGGAKYLQRVISDGPFPQVVTVSVGYQW